MRRGEMPSTSSASTCSVKRQAGARAPGDNQARAGRRKFQHHGERQGLRQVLRRFKANQHAMQMHPDHHSQGRTGDGAQRQRPQEDMK
jgi:hypothetical protein